MRYPVAGRAFHIQAFSDMVLSPNEINTPHNNINAVKTREEIAIFKTLANKVLISPAKVKLCEFQHVCPINCALLPFQIRHQQDNNKTNHSLKIKVIRLFPFDVENMQQGKKIEQ